MSEYRERFHELKRNPALLVSLSKQDTTVNKLDIVEEMVLQPSKNLFWGIMLSLAEDEHKKFKDQLEKVIFPAAREKAERDLENRGIRPTQAKIADVAYTDTAYKLVNNQVNDAKVLVDMLKHCVQSMHQKKDMLQSINSRQRVEIADEI